MLIGVSRPRGPGFQGGGCGLGTRPVLTGVLSGMGSVICGGGLAFDVTVAYEMPPGAGVAETMDGVELAEVVDLFTSLTPRKTSLMVMILAPVASNSRTVG